MKFAETTARVRGARMRGDARVSDSEGGGIVEICVYVQDGGTGSWRVILEDGCGRRAELPDLPVCRGVGKMTFLFDISAREAAGREIRFVPREPCQWGEAWGEFCSLRVREPACPPPCRPSPWPPCCGQDDPRGGIPIGGGSPPWSRTDPRPPRRSPAGCTPPALYPPPPEPSCRRGPWRHPYSCRHPI